MEYFNLQEKDLIAKFQQSAPFKLENKIKINKQIAQQYNYFRQLQFYSFILRNAKYENHA